MRFSPEERKVERDGPLGQGYLGKKRQRQPATHLNSLKDMLALHPPSKNDT
jgi:hypothetical protein